MAKLLLLLTVLISGCASYAPVSYEERCADDGMVLEGIDTGSMSTYSYNQKVGGVNSQSSTRNVRCIVPKTPIEKCEADRLKEIATPKIEYNESARRANSLIGLGYFFYVIPGVVTKIHYDNKLSETVSKSRDIASQSENKCLPKKD